MTDVRQGGSGIPSVLAETLEPLAFSAFIVGRMANDPCPFVLRRIASAVQSADQRRFAFRENGHFIKDGSKQIIVVLSSSQSQILAGSLLEFRIENVGVPLEDVDEVVFNLREQVDPLPISFGIIVFKQLTLM